MTLTRAKGPSGIGTVAVLMLMLVGCSSLAGSSGAQSGSGDAAQQLCSLQGVASLVPQLRAADGRFTIPNPNTDLQKFIQAQQALTNVIDVALNQAEDSAELSQIATTIKPSLTFPKDWRSAEAGIGTSGSELTYPEQGKLSSFGGRSFLNGIAAVPGSSNVFYQIIKPQDPTSKVPALVSAVPTVLPCVNRLVLAAANTAGTWIPPSYVLGTAGGQAYLIVDLCVDLATPVTVNGKQALAPNAELFTAMQWADTEELAYLRTEETAHKH